MTNNQGDVVDGIGGIGGNTDDDDEDEGRYDIYEQDQDGSSSFSLGVDDNDSDSLVPFAHTHHQFTPTLPPTDDNYVDDYYVDETSGQMNMNDDYGNSGRLLAILENAVRVRASQQAQRHHDKNNNNNNSEDFVPTPEELQRKRELLEQTWKEIRTDWLWATETQDDQEERTAAVYCRGTDNLTPLHLICKLTNNPPTDIISEIISAGPEVAGWTDCHMWLPLHHACINGASTEVLTLLTGAYPDGKVSVDVHNRTPLHLYATRGNSDNYNPVTMATNFTILINGGDHGNEYHENNDKNNAAKVRTTNGMLPMHYACAYGTTTSVLKVLEEAYPESINAKDDNGKTPLHMVMVNAQRTASPGVLGFLLNYEYGDDNNDDDDNGHHPDGSNDDTTGIAGASDDTNNNNNINTDGSTREKRSVIIRTNTIGVNVRDYEGNLPLHVLIIGLTGVDFEQNPDKLHNIAECLKLYLASKPYASTDFLAALQSLPDSLQDVAVVTPHVRNILNKKIVERFPTSILMLDGIMLITMIVCFELATTRFIDKLVGMTYRSLEPPLILLYITTGYFFLRELIQVVASLTLGAFTSWLYDTNNWLDVLVITLVTYYSTIMTIEEPQLMKGSGISAGDSSFETFRTGVALTKGVLWTAVIFFLKSTQVDFAVFLHGVFYVVQRLVAFLLAILVILISFAQMFWVVYLEQPVCKFSCPAGDNQCEAQMEGCSYPHCEFGDSFLKVYTMMMGEIGTETRYDQNLLAQILYIFYGFFIVILLSNVLIAIVTDSYEVIQNNKAASVFFKNRLDFVAEMDSIASVVRKRILCMKGDDTKVVPISNNITEDDEQSYNGTVAPIDRENNGHGTEEWFRYKWNSIMSLFEHDVYGDGAEDIGRSDFWIDVLKKTVAIVVIPPWLILGFVTVGILWPPQVREWLFVQKDTVASRKEIERRKLKQLEEIQHETKGLKNEIRMEMQNDREEIFRTKAAIDAVQEEILADLQQVNALVTTLLLDLGGTPLEG